MFVCTKKIPEEWINCQIYLRFQIIKIIKEKIINHINLNLLKIKEG